MKKQRNYRIFQQWFFPSLIIFTGLSLHLLISTLSVALYVLIPVIITAALIMVFHFAEKKFPYRKDWQGDRGDLKTDIFQTFVTLPSGSKLSELVLPLAIFWPVQFLGNWLGFVPQTKEMNFWAQLIIALLASEFCFYWFHRISHNWQPLWKLHEVHHAAERIYWVNSGRFHIVESFLGSFFYFLPLAILGFSPEVLASVISLSAVIGFMEHANIDVKTKIFNYVFNTVELHRWHHSNKIDESNNNFGKVLSVWDILFNTFHNDQSSEVKQVGVEGANVPNSVIGQFLYPFKKKLN